jgi:hypothetical protein
MRFFAAIILAAMVSRAAKMASAHPSRSGFHGLPRAYRCLVFEAESDVVSTANRLIRDGKPRGIPASPCSFRKGRGHAAVKAPPTNVTVTAAAVFRESCHLLAKVRNCRQAPALGCHCARPGPHLAPFLSALMDLSLCRQSSRDKRVASWIWVVQYANRRQSNNCQAFRERTMAGKYNISSASAKLRSSVDVHAVSPKNATTCGIIMTREQAVELASYILAVAGASNAKGLIYITGRPKDNTVTVIRGIK